MDFSLRERGRGACKKCEASGAAGKECFEHESIQILNGFSGVRVASRCSEETYSGDLKLT